MRDVLLLGLALVALGLLGGWIFRSRAPWLGHVLHFGATTLARVLAALALGWAVPRLLEHPNALRIAAATACCLLALYSLLSAVVMGYVLVTGPDESRPGNAVH